MNLKDTISEMTNALLEAEHFLVDVQIQDMKLKKRIQIFLDGDEGINIQACAKVSRKLANELEELNLIETAYDLEVSSPGTDNPLRLLRQYPQHIGRTLWVQLKDEKIVEATLSKLSENILTLQESIGKGKKAELVVHQINFEDIMSAKVLISFK